MASTRTRLMWQLRQLSASITIFLALFTSLSISTSTFDIESERVRFQGFWSDSRSMNRMILMLCRRGCPLCYLSSLLSFPLFLSLIFGHVIKLRCKMQILWKILELSLLFFYTLFPSSFLPHSCSLLPFSVLLVY